MFNDDGTLRHWNLGSWTTGFELVALPEEFGTVRTTGVLGLGSQLSYLPESFGGIAVGGNLFLGVNQLSSLPESFGGITVGGDLRLKNFVVGQDIGPALAEVAALRLPNVKGKVCK